MESKASAVLARLLKQQAARILSEIGYLKASIADADESRMAYLARCVTKANIETALLSRLQTNLKTN